MQHEEKDLGAHERHGGRDDLNTSQPSELSHAEPQFGTVCIGRGRNAVWIRPALPREAPCVVELQANASSACLTVTDLKTLRYAIDYILSAIAKAEGRS